ncbi:MAG: oligosaccharide flippase family protein [Thermoplasmatota archaeon]
MAAPALRQALRALLEEDLLRGTSVNLAFTGMNAVLTIAATIIAARWLGPEGVGILAIGFLIADVVSVLDNWPSQGFVRDYAASPDAPKVATVLGLKGALGLVSTAGLLLLSPFISRTFNVPLVVPLVFSFIPTTSIVSSVALMSWEARRDMARRSATATTEAATRLVLYTLVVFGLASMALPDKVAWISYATLGASAVASLVGLVFIPSLKLSGFDRTKARQYMSFGLRTQGTGALQKVIFWFDILLIDLLLGHATQGLYRTAYTLMSYFALAAATVSTMLYPSLAHAHSKGDREDARRLFSLGFFYSLAIAVPLAAIYLIFPDFILGTLVGPAFDGAAWMMRALALVGVVTVAILPFEAFFPAMGRPDLTLKLALIEMIVNVVLDVALIPRFGVAGAIAASAITFVTGLAVASALMLRLGEPLPSARYLRALFQ